MTLVSIIVPNYNHARYLPQRLDSIFSQTFQDFEIILLDDCSSDNSIEVLQQYANHPKVTHFIVNRTNSGSPFKQWKKGIALASGKYVWIAESDDYADTHFLEYLLPYIEGYPKVGLAYCQSHIINEFSDILGNKKSYTDRLNNHRWEEDYINAGKNEICNYLYRLNVIPNASAAIFRRHLISQTFYRTDMRMCGDWWFWMHLLEHNDIYYCSQSLNYFRSHSETTRANKDKHKIAQNIKEKLEILKLAKQLCPLGNEHKFKKARYALLEQWLSAYSLRELVFQNNFPPIKEYLHGSRITFYSHYLSKKLYKKFINI